VNVDLAEPANKSLRYRELFPGSAFMTPLLRRVLTAVLLLAVFVPAVIWAPAWLWGILMAGVVGMAAREWAHLSHFPALSARLYSALLTLCALVLPTLLNTGWPIFQSALILLAIAFWLVVAPLWLLGRWHAEQPFVRAAVGAVLLMPTWAALLYLHDSPDLHARGPGVLLGVMAIVWIADTAAYFAGRYFGRHKLAPSISPGKTREGVAGAFVALVLYAVVLSVTLKLPMVPLLFAMTGLLYLSVLGDLFESWIKRVSGMKDSGHLLPGHGGVLDRIDALTSTLPMAAALLMWLVYTA
jgi:phosphatidate cytidylyltransferase